MSHVDIARAWRDPKYRRSLTEEQLASLPENPAGLVELTDEDLKIAGGLAVGPIATTAPTCTAFTFLGWAACGCGPITTAPLCTVFTFRKLAACGCP
jgi:mersacidin/lichenicidin family type 2 lantibiotic